MYKRMEWITSTSITAMIILMLVVAVIYVNAQIEHVTAQRKNQEYELLQRYLQIEDLKAELLLHKQNVQRLAQFRSYMLMEVEATAYANVAECCAPYFDGKTATGRDANEWGVAVDPKVIPYGSIVEVDGIGRLLADDCGSAIKGKKIDIRFPHGDVKTAREWGRQKIKVRVYYKE